MRFTYTSGMPARTASRVIVGVASVSTGLTMMASTLCAMKFWIWLSCLPMSFWAASNWIGTLSCCARSFMLARTAVRKLSSNRAIETPSVAACGAADSAGSTVARSARDARCMLTRQAAAPIRGAVQPLGIDLGAPARRRRDGHVTVPHRESVAEEQSLLPGMVARTLDRQLEILPGVGNRAQQVHGAQPPQRAVGAVRRTRQPRRRRHPHDPERARYPAHVHDVGLNDVDRAHLDHPRPGGEIAVLLAAGHVELERIADPFGLLELPVRARLLVVTDPLGLEQMPDLDGAAGGEAAVRIHELGDPVAERARKARHDRLGAAGPFIDVASALGADTPLESVEALFVPQAHEPRGLVGWLNVSSHRGG